MNAKHAKFFDTVIERAEERIQNCEAGINRWVADLRDNPHTAMQNADPRFELAAEWKAAHVIKEWAKSFKAHGREPKELRAEIRDRVMQDSRYVKHSSSRAANQMDVETTAAYSGALDSMSGLLRGSD